MWIRGRGIVAHAHRGSPVPWRTLPTGLGGGGEGRAGRADGAGRTDLRRTQARKRRRSRRRAKTHPGGPGAAAHTPNRARWGGGLGGRRTAPRQRRETALSLRAGGGSGRRRLGHSDGGVVVTSLGRPVDWVTDPLVLQTARLGLQGRNATPEAVPSQTEPTPRGSVSEV